MFVKSLRAALLVATCSAAALAAGATLAQQPAATPAAPAAQQTAEDPVVARVNGKEVKRSEVIAAMQALGPQVQQLPLQMVYPQILENLVAGRLLEEAGYKQKLQDSPEVKEQMKAAEREFVERAYLRKAIDAKLTDERIRKRYDQWVKETPPEDEVRARHILVESKEEAQAILKKLAGGAKFEELAAQQKIDTTSAANQGDLGYFTQDMMVEPFAKAAFAMKKGEVSKEPVETQFGWHIIKVEDRRKQPTPPFEEVAGQFRQVVAQEIAEEVVGQLRKGAKVELFNIDGSPMPAAPAAAPGAAPTEAPAGGRRP